MPNNTQSNNKTLIIAAILILYFVWGSTYLANKIALETMPPFQMLGYRLLIAGAILFTILKLKGVKNPTKIEFRNTVIVGILLLNGGLGIVSFAQQWVSSGLAAIVVSTMPLWLSLFLRFFGEKTSRTEILAMIAGIIGVFLLTGEASLKLNPLAPIVFIGPISWALGSALSRKLAQPSGLMASAIQMFTAGSLFFLIALAKNQLLVVPSARSLVAVIYLIIFGAIIAFSAYVFLLGQNIRPALITSYAYVNPAIAVLLGIFFAHEQFTNKAYLGMLIILISVIVVISKKAQKS
ncbi:MAG TPA: drug/metabolite exporter YedA [Trueperaceae bacterium]|nr:drug/metabolite exporter YedA [Trueperaceae bacterium]